MAASSGRRRQTPRVSGRHRCRCPSGTGRVAGTRSGFPRAGVPHLWKLRRPPPACHQSRIGPEGAFPPTPPKLAEAALRAWGGPLSEGGEPCFRFTKTRRCSRWSHLRLGPGSRRSPRAPPALSWRRPTRGHSGLAPVFHPPANCDRGPAEERASLAQHRRELARSPGRSGHGDGKGAPAPEESF